MVKIRNFILNTDFAMIAQQGIYGVSVTLPGGTVVPAGSVYSRSATVSIPAAKNTQRVQIKSSKTGATYNGSALQVRRTFSGGGSSGPIDIVVVVARSSATQLQITVSVQNPQNFDLTGPAGDETFTANCAMLYTPV